MDRATKIHIKLEKILNRMRALKVIQTFMLQIKFCQMEDGVKARFKEIDSVLKKCLKKISKKPKKLEIRNIITELVRMKNLKNVSIETPEKDFQVPITESLDCKGCEDKSVGCKECTNNELVSSEDVMKCNEFTNCLCKVCGEGFNDIVKLKCHEKKHVPTDAFENQNCSNTVSSLKKFDQHGSIREKEGVVPPSKAWKSSPKENVLKSSKHKVQNKKQLFPQARKQKAPCSNILKSNNLNAGHKVNSENRFTCICGKVFKLRKSLKKHESIKHSAKITEYNCTICLKSFCEKGKLNRHMLSHRSSQYQCSHCPKQFARSDSLARHLSATHDQKKEFSCSYCEKKFSFKYNKNIHEENVHKNLNNCLECEKCGQKFRSKITLRSHMKIHVNNRVNCDVCNKSFSRKFHCKKHMRSKHFETSHRLPLLNS